MLWPPIEPIQSERLLLEPLAVVHADVMVDVLADPSLYLYTGGEPPTGTHLRTRYAALVAGQSADGAQGWLNWIVQRRSADTPIGYVQATIEATSAGPVADIAWVISPEHQGAGMASEGAGAMARWLHSVGVNHLAAHVHPEHFASQGVARRVGLHRTGLMMDGEERWESSRPSDQP